MSIVIVVNTDTNIDFVEILFHTIIRLILGIVSTVRDEIIVITAIIVLVVITAPIVRIALIATIIIIIIIIITILLILNSVSWKVLKLKLPGKPGPRSTKAAARFRLMF